jgi:hypothetical protein
MTVMVMVTIGGRFSKYVIERIVGSAVLERVDVGGHGPRG